MALTRFGSGTSAGGVFGQHLIRHYRPAAQAFGQHLNSTLPSGVWKHWKTKSRLLPHAITTWIDATAHAFDQHLITHYRPVCVSTLITHYRPARKTRSARGARCVNIIGAVPRYPHQRTRAKVFLAGPFRRVLK